MSAGVCPSEDAFAAYVEGSLASAEAAELERHIDRCAGCCALATHGEP